MPDTLSQALRDWQNFYILVGGASAILAGLMFVAISLGSTLITRKDIPALRVFVNPTLIHFIYVLATSAVVLIPNVTRTSLGVVLMLAGIVSLGWTLGTQPQMRRPDREGYIDAHDWTWYQVAPAAAYLLYVGTGIALIGGARQALNGLALASILLLVAGTRNAWDMVVGLALKRTGPPQQESSVERRDAGHPVVERVDAEMPDEERPAMERPDAERPAMERPAMEHPAMERPAMERPAMEHPAMERPAMEHPAMERPDQGDVRPAPTTSLALPASDQAEVTRLIHDAGLPPADFTWALQPNRYALIGPLVSALVHTRTGGYFRFEFTADASRRNRVSVFCPGKGAPEVAKEAGSWENQLGQVRVWLKSLSEVRR